MIRVQLAKTKDCSAAVFITFQLFFSCFIVLHIFPTICFIFISFIFLCVCFLSHFILNFTAKQFVYHHIQIYKIRMQFSDSDLYFFLLFTFVAVFFSTPCSHMCCIYAICNSQTFLYLHLTK